MSDGRATGRVVASTGAELIETHGADWVRLLWAWLDSDARAATAFYLTCVDAWDGLPALQHHLSPRTWCLSRARYHGDRQRRMRSRTSTQPLISSLELSEVITKVRESTPRLEPEPIWARMRESADRDQDATLHVALIARRGLGLSWQEIADVISTQALDRVTRAQLAADLERRLDEWLAATGEAPPGGAS